MFRSATLSRLARSLFNRKPAQSRRQRRTRLECWELEGRIVPANYTWTGNVSHLASNPNNWNTGGGVATTVPGLHDNVNIPLGSPTVDFDGSAGWDLASISDAYGVNVSVTAGLEINGTAGTSRSAFNDGYLTVGGNLTVDVGAGLFLIGENASVSGNLKIIGGAYSIPQTNWGIIEINADSANNSSLSVGGNVTESGGTTALLSITGESATEVGSLIVTGYVDITASEGGQISLGNYSSMSVSGSEATGDTNFANCGVNLGIGYLYLGTVNDSVTSASLTCNNGVYATGTSLIDLWPEASNSVSNVTFNAPIYTYGVLWTGGANGTTNASISDDSAVSLGDAGTLNVNCSVSSGKEYATTLNCASLNFPTGPYQGAFVAVYVPSPITTWANQNLVVTSSGITNPTDFTAKYYVNEDLTDWPANHGISVSGNNLIVS